MKRCLKTSLISSALCLLFLPAVALCTDYQKMTTKELSELRGTMYNASQEDRDAFRAEWTKRLEKMTPEEQEQFLGAGGGRGKGSRMGNGLGDGSGRGKGGGSGRMNNNGVGQENGQRTGQGGNG